MKKIYIIGTLLGILSLLGVYFICSSSIGLDEHSANLINCIISGAGLLVLCYTLYLQSRATELQARATDDQIEANRQQYKAQIRQEILSSFSAILDRKAKIKITPPIACEIPPPEQRTDVSTQFSTHCAAFAIIISRYFDCSEYPHYAKIFKQYKNLIHCLISEFFPYAIAFKNTTEEIIGNKVLDAEEKKNLLRLLHETLGMNDASALGIIFRLPHFKNSEWINVRFSRELCVKSVRESIKNLCANRQVKDIFQKAIGNFDSQEYLNKAVDIFVDGLEKGTIEENAYWSMCMATDDCRE